MDQLLAAEVVTFVSTEGDALWAFHDHLGTLVDLEEYDAATDTAIAANLCRYDSFGNITSETDLMSPPLLLQMADT